MFLLAPPAWGVVKGITDWTANMRGACTARFTERLKLWSAITPQNRMRLAAALCRDDRVFWTFALENDPSVAAVTEELVETKAAKPLMIGIIGQSERENSEALHAVRDLLYIDSTSLHNWRNDPAALESWRRRQDGGFLGGVVFVEMAGGRNELRLQAERAREAVRYMAANEMDAYVFAIRATQDVRSYVNDIPIQWVKFTEPADCEERFR